MKSKALPAVLALGLAVALGGCSTVPGACTTEFVPAIEVEVIDAETGAAAAEGVDGHVFDGTYSDSLKPRGSSSTGELLSLAAAGERPGEYLILLRKPGYRDWTMSHVRVGEDECHVLTRTIVARLQPAP